ncbi:MAG: thiamine phosphate synthase [Rubrobacter sp.]|nr:thiamine phosphate synthase [Rubrobacter sp.]
MQNHHIHLITDRKQTKGDESAALHAALRGGVDIIQIREKSAVSALALFETANEILPVAHEHGAAVSINDRLDVALATGADGVHLAGKSLPPDAARKLWGELLGVSIHSLEEAKSAVESGVDYVTFGHVYPTSSKPGMAPRGVRELARIVDNVSIPVVAIGGIEASNVDEVLSTGASGIAAISTILTAEDPEHAARKLREAVDAYGAPPKTPFPRKSEKSVP